MQIIFVRHGESTQNVADGEYDKNNIVLTELGKKQAKKTGKYIHKIYGKIDAIYHSPIYRCQETAEIIADNMNHTKELIPDKLLIEFNEKNIFHDKSAKEENKFYRHIDKKLSKLYKEENVFKRLKKITSLNNEMIKIMKPIPDFEDAHMYYRTFLNKIKKTEYNRIVVVSHIPTMFAMMKILLNLDHHSVILSGQNIRVSNCSIFCARYDNNMMRLVSFPYDEHLKKINIKK